MLDVVKRRRERGESLIELIVAIFILGVVAVAVLTSLTLAIRASKANRDEALGTATLRNYAEWLQSVTYVPGATTGTAAYAYPTAVQNFTVTLFSVQCWSNVTDPKSGKWQNCTPANDQGIQQLTLKVTSKDSLSNETLSVVLRKPCPSPLGVGSVSC